mmetsp:Transcript_58967/g.173081  ORF Transcript_58967/g.173081 Transcript_58967/m.173081 type:complete len:383 (-) Transcript_58967:997-2145(-)
MDACDGELHLPVADAEEQREAGGLHVPPAAPAHAALGVADGQVEDLPQETGSACLQRRPLRLRRAVRRLHGHDHGFGLELALGIRADAQVVALGDHVQGVVDDVLLGRQGQAELGHPVLEVRHRGPPSPHLAARVARDRSFDQDVDLAEERRHVWPGLMHGGDHGDRLRDLLQHLAELERVVRVEARRRLVQEQHFGPPGQLHVDVDHPPLAAGERADPRVDLLRQGPDLGEEPAAHGGGEADRLSNCVGLAGRGELRHKPDGSPKDVHGHRLAVQADRPLLLRVPPTERLQERALPGADGPHDAHEAPWHGPPVHLPDEVAEAEAGPGDLDAGDVHGLLLGVELVRRGEDRAGGHGDEGEHDDEGVENDGDVDAAAVVRGL